ncbi:YifB family Mg chelatase-like AAA ATPase [Gryllotalpicola protaetiae]|uniref:ATP-binding protein n=1 Tax=Gryllotalpicola protaetiae TaxID=2419771 RepID=A0A387BHJ5_9MICO|nr:YifB family Mg chelatase-like AAA ATPase [Gryllotalpicola protaetiae]AYG02128.1 ATP-binding protein [Gryllotalpicola protaetiae]
MGVARTQSVALQGLSGAMVDVEASITAGLPMFKLIGLPDTSLAEATHRVLAAASNSGCSLAQSRVTANLSPATLPKYGSVFDLGIALATMAAAGSVSPRSIATTVHLGELGLDGRVRPVLGILPAVHAAAAAGARRVMVPVGNLAEARLVPGVDVIPVSSLREAAIRHGGDFTPVEVDPILAAPVAPRAIDELDLADVIGNHDAVRALIIAAAGGHHVYFLGPPGAGKTMLAERLPSLLPDLDEEAALEATSIRSLTELGSVSELVRRPPYESPHHTASAAALVGGGSSRIRPGAAVRATHGVLFLDEAPEFQPKALDALRQPLESGVITISRASQQSRFPAEFQLVLAANPCPCGLFGVASSECTCNPGRRRAYLNRLSGPLMDRIDLQLAVDRLAPAQLLAAGEAPRLTSAQGRQQVETARAVARERFAGTGWRLNGRTPSNWFTEGPGRLPKRVTAALERHYQTHAMTMRGYVRVLRVAWTLADLDGATSPGAEHVGGAIALREGRPA